MRPVRSVVLWFSQRVGSTVLAQALEETGLAGRPREWLSGTPDEILARVGAADARRWRKALWEAGTTPDGTLGLKLGYTAKHHAEVRRLLEAATGEADPRLAFEFVFPDARHLFLTRRDKVRLAVSWWRAIQTATWHRVQGDVAWADDLAPAREIPRAVLEDRYDFAAIDHLVTEAVLREAAIQEVFDRWGIDAPTLAYEELLADFPGTVRRVLDLLRIPGGATAVPRPPAFARLADDLSETWVQRYRRERQDGWDAPAW